MKKINCFKQNGLTFIELLTTLALVGIIAVFAIPSYNTLIQKNKHKSELISFLSGLSSARSEAVKRGLRTVMCTSSDGASCDSSVSWENGWVIFVDDNANNTPDTGETFIRIGSAMDDGYTVTGSTNIANMIRYDAEGDTLESGTLTLCDPRGASDAEAIIITASGKPKVSETGAGGVSLTCP